MEEKQISTKRNSIKRNAFLNFIKQLSEILFPIISFSYSSHILGAANMGIVNYSASIVNYFFLIAALGISTYAVREGAQFRDNKEKISRFAQKYFL